MRTERGFRCVSEAEEVMAAFAIRPSSYFTALGCNVETCPLWDEIRADGIQVMLMYQGRHKFGRSPTKKQLKALEAIKNPALLRDLAVRLLDVASWTELLDALP